MSFLGGIVSLRDGIDGISLSGKWLYFAALNGSSLYRIGLDDLKHPSIPRSQLAARVEQYSGKPLSDGLSTDLEGNIYITDVEHGAIFAVGPERKPRTLLRSEKLRWPDALSFGPGGWLYTAQR